MRANLEKIRLPREFSSPPREEGPLVEREQIPMEYVISGEPREEMRKEFDGRSGGKESETAQLHKLIKRMMLVPVASTVATVSIIFSSMGYDPLGDDFLAQDDYGIEDSRYEEEESGRGRGSGSQSGGSGDEEPGERRQVREYPGDITGAHIEVRYVPTGESYRAQETGEEGLAEARSWVRAQGGDPDTMTYVKSETIYLGYELSDDAIVVGDPDDMENAYVAQGTITHNYGELAYFDAYESMEVDEKDIYVVEGLPICVIFVPTDESYYPEQTGQAGIQEAKEWLRSIGGDPNSMFFSGIRRDSRYEINDGVLSQILTDVVVYQATEYAEGYEANEEEEVFPILPNMDPDFDGNYAWGGMGSEEYVRIFMSDKTTLYLEAGGYWQNNEGATESSLSTCWYDRETNTLTLRDFNDTEAVLDVNLMGNGFKIRLEGDNHIGSIQVWGAMYGGSVAFVGDGNLTIGEAHPNLGTGLLVNAEGSESCVMVGANVFLEISGAYQIAIYDTQAVDPIIMNGTMHILGGEIYSEAMEAKEYWLDDTHTVTYNVHNCGVRDNIGDGFIMIAK